MAALFDAKANAEKRLFISLITRDISLTDAIVDLTDNSVNAALKTMSSTPQNASEFQRLFQNTRVKPRATIKVAISSNKVSIEDNASGIDFKSAMNEVFRFGHSREYHNKRDRLSVYGIGMKRALFKIGKDVSIVSDHETGGFSLNLAVDEWENDPSTPWVLPIAKRPPASKTGTRITITDLNSEISTRIADPKFIRTLMDKMSKVYSYFIGRVVQIFVNGEKVPRTDFEIGENYSHDAFSVAGVDCSITAGIASPHSDRFLAESAGWFVFCNFRTVLYADKSSLTGWGNSLPMFQPKHRPFLGIVLFTAQDPEDLPWTTTKGSLNEDHRAWQDAKLRMAATAKPVLRFLDSRYGEEGTEIQPSGLAKLSGKAGNVFGVSSSPKRAFTPATKTGAKTLRVQFDAKVSEVAKVRRHFGRDEMAASEIGRKAFDYFLRNEVEAG